ncbi:MAG: NIPSNAP family protein [Zhengella sp.]|uniref:NIPSNAP family protein n=1 Tax=Zhengella sp. TaxID=2282762 RepID=UPI001D42C457|nr:NIPSNAP family protein [Notoacmeibacter sp.]MCC0025533.1 NIPSNAP family protein [Brucellaceae bacterium]
MIFELRTYDLKPGKAPVYLDFFRTFGVGLVTRHLPMGGYWMVETGRLNRIEHLWIYADMEERDACRASLVKDRAWMEDFIPRAFADVTGQSNRFMALERSSDRLDAVIGTRREARQNEDAASPLFAGGLNSLSLSGMPLAGDGILGAFRIVSGQEPGKHVTLRSGDFRTLTTQGGDLAWHEIIRPLALSPLA